MRILIIEHAPGRADNIPELMAAYGADSLVWRPYTGEEVPVLAEFEAVIIGGGPMGAYELDRYPFFKKEIPLVKAAIMSLPVLAICLGEQMVAELLGGKVFKTLWRRGFMDVQLTDEGLSDPLFAGMAAEYPVFHYNQDEVAVLPLGAVLLQTSSSCRVGAFRLADRPVWAVQAHPEIRLAKAADIFARVADQLNAEGEDIELLMQLGSADGMINNDRLFANFAAIVAALAGQNPRPPSLAQLQWLESEGCLYALEVLQPGFGLFQPNYLQSLAVIAATELRSAQEHNRYDHVPRWHKVAGQIELAQRPHILA